LCSGSINQRNSLVRKQVIAGRIDVLQVQVSASCAEINPADKNSPSPIGCQLRSKAKASLVPARIADEMSFRQPLCMGSCRDGEDSKGNKNILSYHINLSF
jgi:predicted metal-binding protein